MAREVRRLKADIVIESEPDNLDEMTRLVISRVKSSVDFSNRGAVSITVYDEDGRLIGRNQVGTFEEAKKPA